MERIQKEKPKPRKREEIPDLQVDTKQELKDDLDGLLDEIDKVLEENAEEFVANYIQKGGE